VLSTPHNVIKKEYGNDVRNQFLYNTISIEKYNHDTTHEYNLVHKLTINAKPFSGQASPMLLLTVSLVTLNRADGNEQQWGHWRGPTGNGESLTATPPREFGPGKNCRWKQPIPGRGSSSPVVWDDQVFVTTAIPLSDGRGTLDFRLLCYDRKTGTKQWDHSCIKAIPP
jgi:hypothetical protein